MTPVCGFHVVVPLEDRGVGAPSWRLFLDPLMEYLGFAYYVGLLAAAAHHGASPQAGKVVQVVVPHQRRQIEVGRGRIEFVVNRDSARASLELVSAPSGRYCVATAELTALDLVRYSARAGGWGNVVTVLRDLAPALRPRRFRPVLATEPTVVDVARLGYLLEWLEAIVTIRPSAVLRSKDQAARGRAPGPRRRSSVGRDRSGLSPTRVGSTILTGRSGA